MGRLADEGGLVSGAATWLVLDYGSSLNQLGALLPLAQERTAARRSLSPLLWGRDFSPCFDGVGCWVFCSSAVVDRQIRKDLRDLLTGVNNLITEMMNLTGQRRRRSVEEALL